MGVGSELVPAGNILSGGLSKVMSYAWILIPIVIILIIVGIGLIARMVKKKKSQWTHKLKIRRVIQGGQVSGGGTQKSRLSEPFYINMRRFPLIKRAEVFELEKPLLGGYLIPELDQYSGENEFSIILDTNNRIYTNQGEFFDPDTNCVNVSAKHSEIDIQRSNLKSNFQNINQTNKRIEWAEIAKFAFMGISLIVFMVIAIVAMQSWGDAQGEKTAQLQSEARAMESLSKAMTTMQSVVNTQKLEILPIMQEIYKTKNIQGIINQNVTI